MEIIPFIEIPVLRAVSRFFVFQYIFGDSQIYFYKGAISAIQYPLLLTFST